MSVSYQRLDGGYQDRRHLDDDAPPQPGVPQGDGLDLDVHIAGTENASPHIPDLDHFFRKIYSYHQRHGFVCMEIQDILSLFQHIFLVIFIVFLFSCVDYPILFRDKPVGGHNTTEHVKVKLKDGIIPPGQCIAGLSGAMRFFLVIWIMYVLYKTAALLRNLCSNLEIKRFYTNVLKILPGELDNMTWHNVLQRLLEAQRQGDHPIAVHKQELNELDVYHRILRHDNYLVALVNKHVLPLRFNLPFVGTVTFFSSGLKYNIQLLLFWGLWSPFENNWNLRDDYRRPENASMLADEMSRRFLVVGLINLVCMPFIFVYHLFDTVFNYADMVKREPGFLGARTWSGYSRVYLRHFNELEHELDSRLCMGYRTATQYMNSFSSHLNVILAKNLVFFAASPWVVLVALTIWDEDFLAVEHIVTAIAILSMILAVCRSTIPDEHMVWCPEQLMKTILQHIHYMPDEWNCNAHTTTVRDEFGNLFTYKFTHLLSEIFSAVVTPIMLLGAYRSRSREIVNFFIENSVAIEGVGDVCTFAQMDIEKHGNPRWSNAAVPDKHDEEATPDVSPRVREPPPSKQGEMGKTELSLVHFHFTNPNWNPDSHAGQRFLDGLKSQIDRHSQYVSQLPNQQDELSSTMAVGGFTRQPQGQVLSDSVHSFRSINPMMSHVRVSSVSEAPLIGRGISSAQGPLASVTSIRVNSIEDSLGISQLPSITGSLHGAEQQPSVAYASLEQGAVRMSASAVVLYELHQQPSQMLGGYGSQGTPRRLPSRPLSSGLSNIQESRLETTPLLPPLTGGGLSGSVYR